MNPSGSSDDDCSGVGICADSTNEKGPGAAVAATAAATAIVSRNGCNNGVKKTSSDDGINGCSEDSSRRSSTSSTGSNEGVDGWVVSSESCAFTSIGAKFFREVLPGEIVEISPEGKG